MLVQNILMIDAVMKLIRFRDNNISFADGIHVVFYQKGNVPPEIEIDLAAAVNMRFIIGVIGCLNIFARIAKLCP